MSISVPSASKAAAISMFAICMCGSGLQAAEQCEFMIDEQAVSIWLKDVTGLTNIDERLFQKQLPKRTPFVTCRWKAIEMSQGKSRLNSYTPKSILAMAWTKDSSREVNRLVLSALSNDKTQISPGLPKEIVGDPNSSHDHFTMVAAAKDLAVYCTQPTAFEHSDWGSYWPERDGRKYDFKLKYIQHPSGSYVILKGDRFLGYGLMLIPSTEGNDRSFVADCSKKQTLTFSDTINANIEDRSLAGVIKRSIKLKIVKSLRSGSPSFKF